MPRPRIAVFSGATSTIANTEPLITSNKARAKYGLPPRRNVDGTEMRFDVLRPQRLAAPAKVYVRQFSAHPLEADAAELYGPPDGYLDPSGAFHAQRQSESDVPVYEIELLPEDGLYPLPYMARQANGQPWDGDGTEPGAPDELCRQPFYPDASRLFEEIDRLGVNDDGDGNLLSSRADFDFYRAAPPGGYKKGLPAALRTDKGSGDIPPERRNEDFWAYRPGWLAGSPPPERLALVTNLVQRVMGSGEYDGAIWLEGSPNVEETTYWLQLLIDTSVPICGNASQRAHGSAGNEGDRNIVDSVTYITSRVWAGADGKDDVGVVVIQDQRIFCAREVQKGDARPGGYVVTGGHGGLVGGVPEDHAPVITFRPAMRHTSNSAVALPRLPDTVTGLGGASVRTKENGELLPSAIPTVSFAKQSRYSDTGAEEIEARIAENLQRGGLAGFVGEGQAPYGTMNPWIDKALEKATFCGMPVVKTGRGDQQGFAQRRNPLFIAGSNLSSTKARLLLMACLLKLGTLPAAANPAAPTPTEVDAIKAKLSEFQELFDTH
ncbi:MAG TPA: asparaginase domain-containing protein [Chloroflexota bacterium]|nr:asparaginase domain-containing protein [Chloroflexota bacterium]